MRCEDINIEKPYIDPKIRGAVDRYAWTRDMRTHPDTLPVSDLELRDRIVRFTVTAAMEIHAREGAWPRSVTIYLSTRSGNRVVGSHVLVLVEKTADGINVTSCGRQRGWDSFRQARTCFSN